MGEGDTKRIAAVKPRVSMAQPERVAITGGTLGIGNTSLEESSGEKSSILIPSICLPFTAASDDIRKVDGRSWCRALCVKQFFLLTVPIWHHTEIMSSELNMLKCLRWAR